MSFIYCLYYGIRFRIACIRIIITGTRILHHDKKIGNKSTQEESKRNGDKMNLQIDLHMKIEHANHRERENGTQKAR